MLKKYCFIPGLFRLFFGGIFMAAACLAFSHTVQAEVKIDKPERVIYLGGTDTDGKLPEMLFYIELSDGDCIDISSIRSDNEKVSGPINYYVPINVDSLYLRLLPKNIGRANISFADQSGKSYTVTAEVRPYENPVKSLTISNVNKGKNLAKKVENSCKYGKLLSFSKKTATPKMKVEAEKGWSLMSISVKAELKGFPQYLYSQKINARSKTIEFEETGKGTPIYMEICFRNIENGNCQRVILGKYM